MRRCCECPPMALRVPDGTEKEVQDCFEGPNARLGAVDRAAGHVPDLSIRERWGGRAE